MKHIVLLPGMDGTGILFKPLIQALSSKVHPHIIDYPVDEGLVPGMVLKEVPGPHFILQTRPKACTRIIEQLTDDIPSQEMGNTEASG